MTNVFLQEFAPSYVMRAGLETISWLCIYGRNKSLSSECRIKEINDLMEAVHEVPRMLMSWNEGRLREIRNHFGCFHSELFPGSPDFVAYFDHRLEEYKTEEQDAPSDGDKHPV
jgi:hypothetical protein